VAKGLTFLYRITTTKKGIKSKPELVRDTATIEAYLADELDEEEDEYYFMSTKEPDTKAIDSLLDRVHGKPKQSIDANVAVTFSLTSLLNEADENKESGFDEDTEL
ncbi:MAG: hypothetical protein NTW30_05660, partial [Candidatus Aenigmarchaeota archaeon]|nr:hypothetical protein [Candidatus Aenigmarchaeota archaeon]